MSAEVDAVLELGLVSNCSVFAGFALYYYDRVLTFSREADLIWCRRNMSVATVMYLLLHISVAVYHCALVASTSSTSCERYEATRYAGSTLTLAQFSGYVLDMIQISAAALFHVANGGFTALRAYALSGRSVLLACAIMLFSFAPVAVDINTARATYTVAVPPPIGCLVTVHGNTKAFYALSIMQQASVVVPELLLVSAIWRHVYTLKFAHEARVDMPLTTVILRDGTIYFVAILVVLILNIVLSITEADSFGGSLSPIIYSLQVNLISRFFLNLNEANSTGLAAPSSPSQLSDLHFTRVIGSLGGSLAYGAHSTLTLDDTTSTEGDMYTDEGLGGERDTMRAESQADLELMT